jgi:hypothetical protein
MRVEGRELETVDARKQRRSPAVRLLVADLNTTHPSPAIILSTEMLIDIHPRRWPCKANNVKPTASAVLTVAHVHDRHLAACDLITMLEGENGRRFVVPELWSACQSSPISALWDHVFTWCLWSSIHWHTNTFFQPHWEQRLSTYYCWQHASHGGGDGLVELTSVNVVTVCHWPCAESGAVQTKHCRQHGHSIGSCAHQLVGALSSMPSGEAYCLCRGRTEAYS